MIIHIHDNEDQYILIKKWDSTILFQILKHIEYKRLQLFQRENFFYRYFKIVGNF